MILIGEPRKLDWFAEPQPELPHPLQELLEEFVETQLTEDEKELFYLRYGDQLSIRKIASKLGYNSHQVIQIQLERIETKARLFLKERNDS